MWKPTALSKASTTLPGNSSEPSNSTTTFGVSNVTFHPTNTLKTFQTFSILSPRQGNSPPPPRQQHVDKKIKFSSTPETNRTVSSKRAGSSTFLKEKRQKHTCSNVVLLFLLRCSFGFMAWENPVLMPPPAGRRKKARLSLAVHPLQPTTSSPRAWKLQLFLLVRTKTLGGGIS